MFEKCLKEVRRGVRCVFERRELQAEGAVSTEALRRNEGIGEAARLPEGRRPSRRTRLLRDEVRGPYGGSVSCQSSQVLEDLPFPLIRWAAVSV